MSEHVGISSRLEYRHAVQRVLWITLVLNVAVALAKLVVGLMSNSLSLIGDAAHSAVDTANNVVGLVAVGVATRDADEGHPYGHSKIETLAAFVLAGLLFMTCFNLGVEAIKRLLGYRTASPEVTPVAFVVVIVTLLVNLWVSRYEARRGRELGSEFLLADAAHTRSDILVTLTVLVSLVLVRLGLPHIDAALSLVIAGLIGYIGYEVFQRTVPVLVDASALDEKHVRHLVDALPGVFDTHAVRSRRAGDLVFVDLHIVVDPETDTETAHAVTEAVEQVLEKEFGPTSATVHVETSRNCGM